MERKKEGKEEKRKNKGKNRKNKLKLVKKNQLRNFACGTHLYFAMGKRIQQKILGGGKEIKLK